MSQLTQISAHARKAVLFAVISLVGYFILIIILRLAITYWRATHRPPPTPPDTRFGRIDPPRFTQTAQNTSGLTFTLLTIEGTPPETTASAKIYKIAQKFTTFSTSQRVSSLAKRFDLTEEPIIENTIYRFSDTKNPLRSLIVEGVYFNYQYRYDYRESSDIFVRPLDAPREELIKEVVNYISQKNLFEDTVLRGQTDIHLLRFDPTTKSFIPASSIAGAHAYRVDFFRQDIDGLPLVPPKYFNSYNYVIFVPKPTRRDAQLLELSYTFWPITTDDFATYPLKTAQLAYDELTGGQGYIINKGNNDSQIIIRNIKLAYYDDEQLQLYLQPVFIFEGDQQFAAVIPALPTEWLR